MKKKILLISLVLLYIVCIIRLSYLMFYKKNYYNKILETKNNKIIYGSSAPRGRILDRNGNIIVDNIGIKTIIYNRLKGVSVSDEISVANILSEVIDINSGSDNEIKYFYYINNKDKINNMLDKKIIKKYEERKISYKKLLNYKLDLIDSNIINSLSDNFKKASKIYSIMTTGYDYQDKVIYFSFRM